MNNLADVEFWIEEDGVEVEVHATVQVEYAGRTDYDDLYKLNKYEDYIFHGEGIAYSDYGEVSVHVYGDFNSYGDFILDADCEKEIIDKVLQLKLKKEG